MKKSLTFITTFFLLSILSYIFLSYEKEKDIEEHLRSKTDQYLQNYKVLYDEHKTLAGIIYKSEINKVQVIDIFKDATSETKKIQDEARKKLYNHLKPIYTLFKKYNLKQLHFHLPNNHSFLRVHRPNLYGDDLTYARETVSYVNKYQKPIDTFEEGTLYNGYRFVYPMFYNDKYIGSVEVSFNTLSMNLGFINDYNLASNFLMRKDIVNKKVFKKERSNYIDSPIKNFYFEKAMLNQLNKKIGTKTKEKLSQKTIDIISTRVENLDSFSIYDSTIKEIITLIKVKNEISKNVVGLFIVRSSDKHIVEIYNNFYILLGLINLFIALAIFFSLVIIIFSNLPAPTAIDCTELKYPSILFFLS